MNEEQVNKTTEKDNSRKEEVKVGLRNALDRKESLERAKQSLINAGYDSQIVEAASREVGMSSLAEITNQKPERIRFKKIEKPKEHKVKQNKQKPINQKKESKMNKLPKTLEVKPKKKKIAIYVIISIIILVLAALLGLYWDSLIGMF